MSKRKVRKLVFQNKTEVITLFIAFIALVLSILSFYYQFFHINSDVFITPVYPDNTDANGKIVYRHVFTNSGNNTITILDKNFILHPNKYEIEHLEDIALQIPSDTTDIYVLNPGSTYVSEINVTKEEYNNYKVPDGSRPMITFIFEVIDYMGNVVVLDFKACALPKVIDGKGINRSYAIEVDGNNDKCHISKKILD